MNKIKDTILWQEFIKTIKANVDFIDTKKVLQFMKQNKMLKKEVNE